MVTIDRMEPASVGGVQWGVRRSEKSTVATAVEILVAAMDLSGVVIGILKSPGVGFTLAILAAGGTVAAVLIRKTKRDESLTIR
jgi:hypothetical protein